MPYKYYKKVIIFLVFLLTFTIVSAQSVDQIKQNIDSHSEKIKQLEEEIKVYEKQIETIGGEAKTLQNAIKVLDINQKKLGAEIKKTETNIQKTNLIIKNLSGEIGDLEEKIASNVEAISKILNDINQKDDQSLIESFLTNKSLADVFDEYESISQFQQKVRAKSKELEIYKNELFDKKTDTETEKKKLVSLKTELSDQNKILNLNKKEKNSLLTTTKNKETEYKKILAERQAEKERFERELFQFESQLKFILDPNQIPKSGKIFGTPLDDVSITQRFGDTDFARSGAYNGKGHNGLDFRASVGTPIKSSLSGEVVSAIDNENVYGCGYGRWVMIRHDNGLNTLYAHLSVISVSKGQLVQTGQIIGYSGQTGYATGPHLHFGLFVSEAVKITTFRCKNGKTVTTPAAAFNAYLDPMLYF